AHVGPRLGGAAAGAAAHGRGGPPGRRGRAGADRRKDRRGAEGLGLGAAPRRGGRGPLDHAAATRRFPRRGHRLDWTARGPRRPRPRPGRGAAARRREQRLPRRGPVGALRRGRAAAGTARGAGRRTDPAGRRRHLLTVDHDDRSPCAAPGGLRAGADAGSRARGLRPGRSAQTAPGSWSSGSGATAAAPPSSRDTNPASSRILRPRSRALVSFEPAFSPTTTKSVFFETEPEAFPPRVMIASFAPSRVK